VNRHPATVVAVEPETATVIVQPDQPVACARCAAGRGCGAGVFSRTVGTISVTMAEDAPLPANGERVNLVLESGGLLRGAGIVYGLPLAGALFAAPLAAAAVESDAAVAVAALVGLIVGALVARRYATAVCPGPILELP
jgi:sigma-E factor negative regulatory protein RseC